jgi:hypothetical protein
MKVKIIDGSSTIHSGVINHGDYLLLAEIGSEFDKLTDKLIAQFGANSKNYLKDITAKLSQYSGRGDQKINSYIKPYHINAENVFCLPNPSSHIGGIYFNADLLDLIKQELKTYSVEIEEVIVPSATGSSERRRNLS